MTDLMIPARPTTYSGIRMRSRLEARYAAWLDSRGEEWTYEPRAFANQHGQYLPDFWLPAAGKATETFIEVRPHVEGMALALPRMQIIWDSIPDAFLLVTAPGIGWQWFATGQGSRRWLVVYALAWS